MRKIIFSTESGSDLSPELIEKYEVQVVPMHIVIDGVSYSDQEITSQYMLAYYERSKYNPTTGPTTEAEYLTFFEAIFRKHEPCTIIHIGYSSKPSQSYSNAKKIQAQFEHLVIIDSQNISGGIAAVLVYAAELVKREPQMDLAQLVRQIEALRAKVKALYIAKGTDFLLASGRIENREELEQIPKNSWPILETIEGRATYSTYKKNGPIHQILATALEQFIKQFNLSREVIYLVYSLGLSERVRQDTTHYLVSQEFKTIVWLQAGSMTSTHFGPGGFGLAGIEA